MNFQFTKYSIIYFIIALVAILASITCLIVFGLKLGMDFEGGSLISIQYSDSRPEMSWVKMR